MALLKWRSRSRLPPHHVAEVAQSANNERVRVPVKGYTSWLAKAESFAAAQAARTEGSAGGSRGGWWSGVQARARRQMRNGCGDWVAKAEAAAVLQQQGRRVVGSASSGRFIGRFMARRVARTRWRKQRKQAAEAKRRQPNSRLRCVNFTPAAFFLRRSTRAPGLLRRAQCSNRPRIFTATGQWQHAWQGRCARSCVLTSGGTFTLR